MQLTIANAIVKRADLFRLGLVVREVVSIDGGGTVQIAISQGISLLTTS